MNNFYSHLTDAIHNNINMERLYLAAGLDETTFRKYVADELFSSDQEKALAAEIKDWRKGL